MVNIQDLFDDARCYQTIRDMRWPEGVTCSHRGSASVIKNGRDDTQPDRQRYECRGCRQRFDDPTSTIFAGHHQPPRDWIACLYLMDLNLSGLQIASELDLNKDNARAMIGQLRQGIVDRRPPVVLDGEVECGEVDVVAGHKGQAHETNSVRGYPGSGFGPGISAVDVTCIIAQATMPPMRKPYTTDLTDTQWEVLRPLIPDAKPGGRPREVDLREVMNTLLYQDRTGCRWELLPHDLLPKSTVFDSFKRWRDDGTWQAIVAALRVKVRREAGREGTPEEAVVDSLSVKTTEVGGEERGYDGGKQVSGRKRHIAVDMMGLLLGVAVTASSADDGNAAPEVFWQLDDAVRFPRLKVVYADEKYKNKAPEEWLAARGDPSRVEVVSRPEAQAGFVKLPKRWVVERGLAWPGRDRRHSKDSERAPRSSEAWVRISSIRGRLRRLAPDRKRPVAPFNYPQPKAA